MGGKAFRLSFLELFWIVFIHQTKRWNNIQIFQPALPRKIGADQPAERSAEITQKLLYNYLECVFIGQRPKWQNVSASFYLEKGLSKQGSEKWKAGRLKGSFFSTKKWVSRRTLVEDEWAFERQNSSKLEFLIEFSGFTKRRALDDFRSRILLEERIIGTP